MLQHSQQSMANSYGVGRSGSGGDASWNPRYSSKQGNNSGWNQPTTTRTTNISNRNGRNIAPNGPTNNHNSSPPGFSRFGFGSFGSLGVGSSSNNTNTSNNSNIIVNEGLPSLPSIPSSDGLLWTAVSNLDSLIGAADKNPLSDGINNGRESLDDPRTSNSSWE